MSQIGNITSVGSFSVDTTWRVQFTYQLDAGGIATTQILVGNSLYTGVQTVALWTSAASIAVPLSFTPGTSNQVLLPCPDIIKTAALGVPINDKS